MSDAPPTLLESARAYLARGYAVIPVPSRTKAPAIKGWTDLRLSETDLPQHFNGSGNIGLLLGEPSGWLVDVDLDCEEAVALATEFLPPTSARSGRPGKPASHWWYICEGAKTRKHQDPASKKMIVELRSTGAQTIVGPSIHPSGEPYDPLEGEPAVVDAGELTAAVAALAEAVTEARHGRKGRRRSQPEPLGTPTSLASDALLRRAAAYLDRIPPAISGSGGHSQTYAAATAMVHGFGLDPEAAFSLLWDRYNPRCEPPWSEKEMRHKVTDAASKPHARPHGWLRDAERPMDTGGVDLSGFDPGPFPSHLLSVPGFVGRVIEYNIATAHRPQPVLALCGAVCLQALLAARKVMDRRRNRTNIYAVGVAPSGGGKEHARQVSKRILYAAGIEHLEGNEDIASDSGLFSAVESQPAIMFQLDEFGRFLRTIGDPRKAPHLYNVIGVLMRLYSSADSVFRGKAYANKKLNKVVDQPCVILHATTVPEHFFLSLTSESMSDGFLARVLIFETSEMPDRRCPYDTTPPEDVVATASWWGSLRAGGDLRSEHPDPIRVEHTPEAETIFGRLAGTVDREMRAKPATASVWARAEEKACRLALIYACSADPGSPRIDADAAGWAAEVSEYMTRRMIYLADEWVSDGTFDARQKRVIRIIRDHGASMSRSELCRRTQWLTQRERNEIVENLIETGAVLIDAEMPGPSGGRAATIYRLA